MEVSSYIHANHAGGWTFRLCKAEEELTEECFQRTPVPFADAETTLRLTDGTVRVINATLLRDGTWPVGSVWKVSNR